MDDGFHEVATGGPIRDDAEIGGGPDRENPDVALEAEGEGSAPGGAGEDFRGGNGRITSGVCRHFIKHGKLGRTPGFDADTGE
jgi:hypothetical protein